jgi:SWI/SNF-related matrix-associated actin-dependent regulator 1 of chromatin subfamily A
MASTKIKLRPHQKLAAKWLVSELPIGPHRGLFDLMRVGKTFTLLEGVRLLSSSRVLIPCPSIALAMWPEAIEAYLPGSRVQVLTSGSQQVDPTARFVIVSYGLYWRPKILSQLLNLSWDIILPDEAHMLKTPSSSRTKALYGKKSNLVGGIGEKAERIWIATGTPAPNFYNEMWTHFRALWPSLILTRGKAVPMDYWRFTKRFCVTRPVPGRRGAEMVFASRRPEEFQALLAPVMMRRTLDDVEPGRPGYQLDTYPMEPTGALDDYGLPKGHPEVDDIRLVLESAAGDKEANFLLHVREKDHIATILRLTGLAKVGPTLALLKYELETDPGKLVAFYINREVGDQIQRGLEAEGYTVARIGGGLSLKQKREQMRLFKEDPRCRVFLGQIIACGTVINLSEANRVFFVQVSWTPSDNDQALSRCAELGKTAQVYVWFLHIQKSIDRSQTRSLAMKARDLSAANL